MQHLFSQVPTVKHPRSKFNRGHNIKTTFDGGYLIPFYLDEVLPGDTFSLNCTNFIRIATLLNPIMDDIYFDTHFFFVPERLVFENFQKMCGEQENPDDSTDYIFPTVKSPSGGFTVGSLADYFGLPTGVGNLEVRAEPFRCYNLIWNEWFRDENLQDSVTFTKADSDNISNYSLLKRGKRHDYFTSALPWPQKLPGQGVDLPIGSLSASLKGSASVDNLKTYNIGRVDRDYLSVSQVLGTPSSSIRNGETSLFDVSQISSGVSLPVNTSGLSVTVSDAEAVTINALREAFQVQRWYERAARGGTRYTEIILSFFGVKSPDARLQRPEFLGGSTTRLNVNSVPQTGSSDETTPQGNLAAYGVAANSKHGFTKSFTEHGWILGFISARSNLTYQQGINRMWTRSTKFDMYWEPFAHLGEQAVLNKEIYAQGTDVDDEVFGYQERYAEYRYYPSLITGQFRSTFDRSLDSWHLAQKFDNLPQLNEEFIEENPPIDRIIAVQNYPQFLLDTTFDVSCVRVMPVYSVPGLIDHL